MKTVKLSASVVSTISGFLSANFALFQEGLVILKKQTIVYEDFLAFCDKSKAKGVKDVEPLKVVISFLHGSGWPNVREKMLGINKVESLLINKASFDETGELVEDSLNEVELSQYMGIQFYHGLQKHLAYKRKVAYQAIISDHADLTAQAFADSEVQTEEVKKHMIFTGCDTCLSALSASGLVNKDNEKQVDKAETDFFVAMYDRGLSVASEETETEESETETDETLEQAETILHKSDANIGKAFAKIIDSQVSDDNKEQAFELFETLCGMIETIDYDVSIQDLG